MRECGRGAEDQQAGGKRQSSHTNTSCFGGGVPCTPPSSHSRLTPDHELGNLSHEEGRLVFFRDRGYRFVDDRTLLDDVSLPTPGQAHSTDDNCLRGRRLQAKLDELILTSKLAQNKFIGIEKLDEKELKRLREMIDRKAGEGELDEKLEPMAPESVRASAKA